MNTMVKDFFTSNGMPLALALLAMNLAAFLCMGLDKRKAKSKRWRISEASLLVLCFFGGALGGLLGMLLFRHKTRHLKFMVLAPLFLVLQLIPVALYYLP